MSLELRPYQAAAIEQLREGIRAGHKRQILYAPTGAGKTEMAMALILEADQKFSRTAFLIDRIALCNQSADRFASAKIPFGVIQAGHWRWRPYERHQICSVQTLVRRGMPEGTSMMIVDECFAADALVNTLAGPRRIEDMRVGDAVYNATGMGIVVATQCKPALRRMVTIRTHDGSVIRCTEEHRFFTGDAWIPAGKLAGKSIARIESMPQLWRCVRAQDVHDKTGISSISKRAELERANRLLEILCEEVEEPHALGAGSFEDVLHAAGNRASSVRSGRQRKGRYFAAACHAETTWEGLAGGVRSSNRAAGAWLPDALQTGYCAPGAENRDRSGRRESLRVCETSAGQEEGCLAHFARVDSVEVEECESIELVYNLHVSGHPSYFVDGLLVHNCHTMYRTTTDFIQAHPEIITIGLTATPFTKGMGQLYSNVVNVATTDSLIEEGFLVPIKAYAAKAIDMRGAAIKFNGEWTDQDIEYRAMTVVGDIVSEWIAKTSMHFNGPVKTLAFSASVAHGEELCRRFQESGYNFQQISYKDGNDERRAALIEEFRKEDSEIMGLVSCEALAKGFDCPSVLCGISARPYRKSLSGHIQQIGRLMRPHPGKSFALLNDHSGNFLRFFEDTQMVFSQGIPSLDERGLDNKVRPEPSDDDKKANACGSCGYFMTGPTCPACGWERPARQNLVQEISGELHEVSLKKSKASALDGVLQDKDAVWRQICHHALDRKNGDVTAAERFAKAQYRNLYGTWPRHAMRNITPEAPHYLLINKIKQNLIAWSRRAKS